MNDIVKEFEKISLEIRKIPILKALPALGMSKKTFIFLIGECLIDLRYLFKKPTGQQSDDLISAIKRFQSDIGQEPTGIMLMGEFEELTKRQSLLGFIPIYPGGFHVNKVGDLVSVEGTWIFENEENADYQHHIDDQAIACPTCSLVYRVLQCCRSLTSCCGAEIAVQLEHVVCRLCIQVDLIIGCRIYPCVRVSV